MENYCISVDWLQTFCLGREIVPDEYHARGYLFRIELKAMETAQFKRVYHVWIKNKRVATIQQAPRTSVINPHATLVKLENRVLYSQDFINILYALHEGLNLTYKGITRIDICYDCNYYYGHRKPSRFINQYVSKTIDDEGFIHRSGSNKFSCSGSKTSSSSARISSIRFGSRESRVGAYIYDKTIEMKEVKRKPWIEETWERNGLISNDKTHVYRAEISIKAQGRDILNMSSGQLFKLQPEYLSSQSAIEKLFFIYAEKYFDFRIKGKEKLVRNFKKLTLFERKDDISSRPVQMNNFADTGRMEKICINKLLKLSSEYSNISGAYTNALQLAIEFLRSVSGDKENTIRLKKQEEYLQGFRASKWIEDDYNLYIRTLQFCHEKEKDIDIYGAWSALKLSPLTEPMIYDRTPDEYIY